ncbi:antA/AntB antirepressor family protein [Lentilactobacillus kisonensis]|uniref:AntA/AntB antirepressor domain-containing protein n=1 Tax=Lentilactobacillus kisonensis DSM 19906 = JCM 15041 TaxID=1423766 RepID=A0A0R1NUA5_9LACO|nr:antA/AntB antirepressor family protein [Lentilactobacillus kisonensis]KRL21876.1 hypothetical protein FC98_GL000431 [Lentilactobacillus kisonensis DSM 19906 = JCM 15041]
MDQLIKILKHDDEMVVSGRDLHDFLEVDTPYRIWIQRMIEYGFHENADYISFEQKSTKPQGGRPQVGHALKLDMAKEIAMIQRTDKGKGEYSYISTRVKHAVNGYIDIHHLVLNRKQRGMLYKDISRGLNEVTGVKTRTQLRKKDFDTADEFVTNWVPSTATLQIIKQLSDVPEGQTELIRR